MEDFNLKSSFQLHLKGYQSAVYACWTSPSVVDNIPEGNWFLTKKWHKTCKNQSTTSVNRPHQPHFGSEKVQNVFNCCSRKCPKICTNRWFRCCFRYSERRLARQNFVIPTSFGRNYSVWWKTSWTIHAVIKDSLRIFDYDPKRHLQSLP